MALRDCPDVSVFLRVKLAELAGAPDLTICARRFGKAIAKPGTPLFY
jgi:hypothetical protein